MGRIAVAGFFHETNTFAPYPADMATFRRPGSFPGLTAGDAILSTFIDLNIPISGAIARLRELGHSPVPTAYASAVPSGPVTTEAFETIGGMILEGIAKADGLDGVYLDLHGAMVTDEHENAETELVRRIRALVGPDLPIVASFDLHANLTQELMGGLDALTAFRTYPHLDMADAGARAADALDLRLAAGRPFARALRKLPFLVPLHAQSTETAPAAAIYELVEAEAARPAIVSAEFALGFPPADIHECGPAVAVFGRDEASVQEAASRLERAVLEREQDFAIPLLGAAEAVREARRLYAGKPVVIADTQDNPGAGGAGDTVGMLRALIEEDAPDSLLAILHDPAAARRAHELGEGVTAAFSLGAHTRTIADEPVEGAFTVERLGDGRIVAVGPMFRGNQWEIGATALLRKGGVRVIVSERRLQAHDTAVLRHVGLEPERLRIIVLKSSVHFRADYKRFADTILVGVAPGLHLADNSKYAYRRLRDTVRRMPRSS